MFFYINGYGVPKDILSDGNYGRYLSACLSVIEDSERAIGSSLSSAVIYLAGGATNVNFPDQTEAGEMLKWFLVQGVWAPDFRLIEDTLDLRGNLKCLRREIGADSRVTIFCEYARQDYPRFLAGRLFFRSKVVPISFDGDAGDHPLARLRQLAALPLRVAAWYSPFIRHKIEYPLRLWFIRRWGRKTDHRP